MRRAEFHRAFGSELSRIPPRHVKLGQPLHDKKQDQPGAGSRS
jgi:hypothetical protein